MPLKKPPLVETWMSIRFEPATSALPWDVQRYKLFFNRLGDSYPKVEQMTRHQIRIETSRRGGPPQIKDVAQQVLAIRAFTEDGLRVVQLTPDQLSANYLRGDTDPKNYPGFGTLLDEALAHYRQYVDCYHPLGVLEVALHYVDLVEIPTPASQALKSEDYFTLDLRVPQDVFGSFAAFHLTLVGKPSDSADLVQLVFATESNAKDASYHRFRLEWHTAVRTGSRMTENEVRANLQAAHDRLEKCFRHAFTAQGWALFEPEETT